MMTSLASPPAGRPSPPEAARLLQERRAARRSLEAFTRYTKLDYDVNWHHRVLCEHLDRFVAGEIKRLMVFMPPRMGKSELVSRRLPARILGENPDAGIIACSYGADLAGRMNRDVQRIIESGAYAALYPETRLFGSNVRTVAQGSYLRNSDLFEIVGHDGFYRSAGVGGGITGMGCQFGLIDDPIKNRLEAESATYRDALWDWYTSTFYTRLEKDACVLLTMTRWHKDDLAGRLLAQQEADPDADQWTVISFPAVAEGEPTELDPRHEGEALWPAKYDEERLRKMFLAVGSYQAASLYQQRPRLREGGMFKAPWFPIVEESPVTAERVRYWDKAGTAGGGKFTAGVRMARAADGLIYVEDVIRGQWSSGERRRQMKQTAQLDAERFGNAVAIWVEQEPGSGGKESAETTVQDLAGYPVRAETVTGSKETRADPFAAQCEAGNVRLVRAPWNAAYIDELCDFPKGTFTDQVDASSGAFNRLTLDRDAEEEVVWMVDDDDRVEISPF